MGESVKVLFAKSWLAPTFQPLLWRCFSFGRLTRDGKDEKKYERMRLGVGCLAAWMSKWKYQDNFELLIPGRGDADANQASLAYRSRRSCCRPPSNRLGSTSRGSSDSIGVERAGHLR